MKNTSGYGYMWSGGRRVLVHRLAYELAYGPIPSGKQVCHRCDVRACCEATHLWLGSFAENMADMVIKGRGKRDVKVSDVGADFAERRRAGRERLRPSGTIPEPPTPTMPERPITAPAISKEELIRRHLSIGASHKSIARRLKVGIHTVEQVANTRRGGYPPPDQSH